MFLIVSMLMSGCVSTVNVKAYNASSPKRIGVVIGHDIKAVADLTTGQIIILSVMGGAIGGALGAENTEKWKLAFEKDITNSIWDHIRNDMQRKNYAVQLALIKPKEWKMLDNILDTEEVYPGFINYYQLVEQAKNYDAILFVDVLIEGRITEGDKIENVTVENMKMKYAKSKMYLYDTATGKRLFYDAVQRGYSLFNKTKLSEALDTIIALEPLPAVSIQ